MKNYLIKSTFKVEPSLVHIPSNHYNEMKGLKIIHISDLHINTKTTFDEIEYLINTINSIDADMLIISGDLIDCKVNLIQSKLKKLNQINKTIFFVSGNHDLYNGYDELKKLFFDIDVIVLDNSYTIIMHNGFQFVLWGLSDRFSFYFGIKRNESELIKTINEFKMPKILVAHQPKDYIFAIKTNSNIFLTGHTHGGQIFPFNFFVRLFQPFVAGLYYVKNLAIYVNSGLGSWGIKYRFLTKQEITLIQVV